ncbi:MAG: type II toxin-antitoxin system Phd/YefM family antitoxin [Ruminococcaceae bacterium]|nr:type II toxin-antitoxin system Phd/YefM family antitoxin [Oscillospiraceae bacterium]
MKQMSIVDLMNAMVPITRFNKGEAAKIFDEVESVGVKIVVKNNRPACVLVSPTQYEMLTEMLSDYALKAEAEKRVAINNDDDNVSHEEIMKELGITDEDLADVEVDID